MKISELIKSLEDKKKELGDIEVVIEASYPDSHYNYLSYNIGICKEENVVAYINDDNKGRKIFDTCLLLF
ncbi:hypothetical protein CY789_09860 [Campylobacter coli]|uniref:hypothetical protein n=1 Tax=Campylobacter jejuni TaxID=197 RepID=UPI00127A54D7|nr:hypothetical protein [Campylobacter jejuni]EAI8454239.1 hypothetical protein [Campylobacter coli]EAI8854533.1 hypothetical protein [Campylobacter coli]EAI8872364.1 hypothetical protein [Campylobacter coli]EAI8903851.1 hypothetical protein [Campylobacter coli]EAI8932210.1 hypothetical protein [Campylobacter coli]